MGQPHSEPKINFCHNIVKIDQRSNSHCWHTKQYMPTTAFSYRKLQKVPFFANLKLHQNYNYACSLNIF